MEVLGANRIDFGVTLFELFYVKLTQRSIMKTLSCGGPYKDRLVYVWGKMWRASPGIYFLAAAFFAVAFLGLGLLGFLGALAFFSFFGLFAAFLGLAAGAFFFFSTAGAAAFLATGLAADFFFGLAVLAAGLLFLAGEAFLGLLAAFLGEAGFLFFFKLVALRSQRGFGVVVGVGEIPIRH